MDTRQGSVHLLVSKEVAIEHNEQWLAMARELAKETWKEDGCISYTFVRNREDPTRFFIIEEWRSQQHLTAHMNTEHFKKYVPAMDAISTTPAIDLCFECLPTSSPDTHKAKILVLYDSSTDCTEKMAELVAEGAMLVDQTEVRIRAIPGEANHWDRSSTHRSNKHPFATFNDIYWADGLACGSPTNLGCISWRMKKFWDDFSQDSVAGGWGAVDGKIGCSFTSNGGAGGGGELVNQTMNAILMNFGIAVLGITDYVSFKQTMHYGAVCAKAPREPLDRMPCIRQGTRLAEFVGLFIHGRQELHPLRASKAVDSARWGHPGIPPRDASMQELVDINRRPFSNSPSAEHNKIVVAASRKKKKVLIYTRMMHYVHGSTAAAAAWVQSACASLGWESIVSDDDALFNVCHDKTLHTGATAGNTAVGAAAADSVGDGDKSDLIFDLIVLVNNSGDIFDPTDCCNLLTRHVAAGRGVLGIHASLACFLSDRDATGATHMEPTSPIIEGIFRAHFKNHPPVQTATVSIDAATARKLGLSVRVPHQFVHTDEFFNYSRNPCDNTDVTVLAYVDERSYSGGLMGGKHPVVWYHTVGERGAPVFYCALGHFSHFYNGLGTTYITDMLRVGLVYCGR